MNKSFEQSLVKVQQAVADVKSECQRNQDDIDVLELSIQHVMEMNDSLQTELEDLLLEKERAFFKEEDILSRKREAYLVISCLRESVNNTLKRKY
eukprot:gene865-619_t